ncbi:MAG: DMT family transporter [Chloroflexi bacterium]|nr:DMT family transporter [Chloroflexota bacterium]
MQAYRRRVVDARADVSRFTTVPRSWLPLLALTVTVIIWASNNVISKVILREASPGLVALMRFSLAGLLFYGPVFLRLHQGDQRFTRWDWPRLIFLGAVGIVGSLILSLMGLQTTPPTDAAVYMLTTPLFVLLLARLFFNERLTQTRLIGIGVAFLGALILAIGSGAGIGGGDVWGALAILTSSVIWSAYTLLSKEVLARRSPLLVLATANTVAMIAIWPIGGTIGVWEELPQVLTWSLSAWAVMAYLVVLMSMLSQWLYVRSLRDLQASQVSALLYTQPLFTAIIAAAFGEPPTVLTAASGILILGGVLLVNRPVRTRQRAAVHVATVATRHTPDVVLVSTADPPAAGATPGTASGPEVDAEAPRQV